MKVETMKSVVLVILIAFSLLLSVALWNYQPQNDEQTENQTVDDITLDQFGSEKSIRELIEPAQFVFHEDGVHYSFSEYEEKTSVYEGMSEWQITPVTSDLELPDVGDRRMMEIIFRTELPVESLGHIFAIENFDITNFDVYDSDLYDRIFVVETINQDAANTYELWAVLSGESEPAVAFRATINQNAGGQVFSYLDEKEALTEQLQLLVDEDTHAFHDAVYIPKSAPTYPSMILQTNSLQVRVIKNYLFPQVENMVDFVQPNGVRVIRDVENEIKVYEDQRYLDYIYKIPNNSQESNYTDYELLLKSVQEINDHLGWTNHFRLALLNAQEDRVLYHMYFNDLPILKDEFGGGTPLVTNILLEYEQLNLQRYVRPSVRYISPFDVIERQIQSGEQVLQELVKNEQLENIQNVKVGYELQAQENALAYNIKPEWFIQWNNGEWEKLFQPSTKQEILEGDRE